ncbi:PAS-domain containing protein [Novosphingobium tardum]|uniref:histidine kinase n=1 Tax=Novosphingobium tardum TaxID=1538021 RepID=A0ABV8RR01_9SPHN
MILSQTALALIGLLLAAWTLAAAWAFLSARRRERRAEASQRLTRRLSRMIDEAPALPLLVRSDGRIEGPARLAAWLGLDAMPGYLSELDAGTKGLSEFQLGELTTAVRRTQKTAAPFKLVLTPRGSRRSLALRGHLADPQVSPGGAALVWVFDFSDSEAELRRLRDETSAAQSRFAALAGLIEAAPLPMWSRDPDGRLQLVNTAYVAAVGGASAESVVEAQTELVEPVDGLSAAQVAQQSREQNMPLERVVTATVSGPQGNERRSLRVTDLPIGSEGVAGYAVDIEELEEQTRAFRAFRDAQRDMLDILSAGIAQFDAAHRLVFANQPFLRQFAIPPTWLLDAPPFDRVFDKMRDNSRLPEVRDFPEWRRERQQWFHSGDTREEAWSLSDGTHLRVVAQPMPDGGLLLIFEDRTEQLQLSATRDTLLRTRTATFDNLFESLAVFAPDGRLALWNRRFAADWGLDDAFLDEHPKVEPLLARVASRLKRPAQVEALGQVIRAATLERIERSGRAALADGRFLEFAGVPLPDGNGLLTVLDITDSQKAQAALSERNAALVEADAVKTRFIANMAYEFRTPLTSIGGFAEMLEAGVAGELGPQAREYVAAILSSVHRLGEQIENVLDLAQSEAGTLPFQREPVELRSLIVDLLRQRRERVGQAGLTVDLRGTAATVPVEGDARRLSRAFAQLIDNAIAATPSGGRILVEVTRRPRGAARVVVSDNGPGMDPATLARALDGMRVAPDGKTVDRRQGLGLPLARQLVEGHGGKLELLSEPGQGTAAIVTLP